MNKFLDDELNVPRSGDPLGLLDFERIVHNVQPKRRKAHLLKAALVMAPIALIGAGTAAALLGDDVMKGQGLPVIGAGDTPIKERPAQPGGMQIPHRDKTVFSRAGLAEQDNADVTLVQGPENPVAIPKTAPAPLAPKKYGSVSPDQPAGDGAATGQVTFQPAAYNGPSPYKRETAVPRNSDVSGTEIATVSPDSIRTPTGANTESRDPALSAAPAAPDLPRDETVANQDSTTPAPPKTNVFREVASLSPDTVMLEPPSTRNTSVPDEATAPKSSARRTGRWMVQIAAVGSPNEARDYWTTKSQKHPGVLGDLNLVVEKTVKNGTTYFRVRGGRFKAKSSARKRCRAAKSEGLDCIVVAMD